MSPARSFKMSGAASSNISAAVMFAYTLACVLLSSWVQSESAVGGHNQRGNCGSHVDPTLCDKCGARLTLPRRSLQQLRDGDPLAAGGSPLIVTGALGTHGVGLDASNWTTARLQKIFKPNTFVHNINQETDGLLHQPFSDFIKQLEVRPGEEVAAASVYGMIPMDYEQWGGMWQDPGLLTLREAMGSMSVFDSDSKWLSKTCLRGESEADSFVYFERWRAMIIGLKHSGMEIHQDSVGAASWQLQLRGQKRWVLCSPDVSSQHVNDEADLMRNPEHFPGRCDKCFDDVVHAGDFVYYPSSWWHQTDNTGDLNIAISNTVVSAHNFEQVIEDMKANFEDCEGPIHEGFNTPEISDVQMRAACRGVRTCFSSWRKLWSEAEAVRTRVGHKRSASRRPIDYEDL